MIHGAFSSDSERRAAVDLTKGKYLVGLSSAVSIDALAAGTSLGVTNTPIALDNIF